MSRKNTFQLRLLGLFAVIALAVFVSGCGGDSDEGVSPDTAVADALTKASTIKSGESELKATINTGGFPPSFDITGGGPFDTEAEGGAAFDLDLVIQVAGTEQQIGFAAVDGKRYLKVGDKAAETEDSTSGSLDPTSVKGFIDSLDEYVSNAKQLEDKTVDGETLKVYSMDIDVKKLFEDAKANGDDISKLSIPALGSVEELAEGIDDATGTIAVAGDGYPRELSVNVPITNGTSEANVRGTITLSKINESVTIEKPSNIVDESELGGIAQLLGS